jgi:Zn-dependent peptidase ImmA (M78 family)
MGRRKMTTRDVAHVSGTIISWALRRARISTDEFAKALGRGFTAEKIEAWINRDSLPTFAQAERIAQKLHIPLGVLFMADPPTLDIPIPDLRTVGNQERRTPSIGFFELLGEVRSRQSWYRDMRKAQDATPFAFVGRFKLGAPVLRVASDMEQTLDADRLRHRSNSWEQFLNAFVTRIEELGILVMRSPWVRHHFTRELSVEEFRGFALSDKLAPVIFVNSADAKAAQIFTLAHELAHLWIGESGISNADPKIRASELHNPIEQYCNSVAAEFLIPAAAFRLLWDEKKPPEANITKLATVHRVSKIAATIRARDLNAITALIANEIIDAEYARFWAERARMKEELKEKESGPGFWKGFTDRVSARFSEAVFSALDKHEIMFRDAAQLFGVPISTLDTHPSRLRRA